MTYYGIADANGLESFMPVIVTPDDFGGFSADPKQLGMLSFRANANRHRHACVYQADVSVSTAKKVIAFLDEGNYIDALHTLKAEAREISLAKQAGSERSWKLIPNPDLDPFS